MSAFVTNKGGVGVSSLDYLGTASGDPNIFIVPEGYDSVVAWIFRSHDTSYKFIRIPDTTQSSFVVDKALNADQKIYPSYTPSTRQIRVTYNGASGEIHVWGCKAIN